MKNCFQKVLDNKASAGYLYPIGGFCILDTVNPKPTPTAFNLERGQSHGYKRL